MSEKRNINDKILKGFGEYSDNDRSKVSVIKYNNIISIKKEFKKNTEYFENEIKGYSIFNKYDWCPILFSKDNNYLITEYFNYKNRLDQLKLNKDKNILKKIINVLLDIYNEGYSHSDFHTKNIFIVDDNIKIIDFETIYKYKKIPDFVNSHDILGKSHTPKIKNGNNNMCVFNKSEYSISSYFNINYDEFLQIYKEITK